MNHSNIIFCNGLVEKPSCWAGHLESLDRMLASTLGRADAQVQINVDWRPTGMSVEEAVGSARARYGGRIKSIVTYWDPAHSAVEIVNLFEQLAGVDRSLLVRLVLRSAESVRVLGELLSQSALSHATVLLNVDALSPRLIRRLQSVAEGRVRFQVSHETPRGHIAAFGAEYVGTVQVAIGSANNIDERGGISLDDGMVVRGSYKLFPLLADYIDDPSVKLVVMGPTLPEWGEPENACRLAKALPLICQALTRSEQRAFQQEDRWEVSA